MKINLSILEIIAGLTSLINYSIVNSCSWTASGKSIDLTSLSSKTLSLTDGSWTYYYTPCSDGLTCTDSDGVSQSAMADQFKEGNNFCTAYLALWVDTVEPVYSDGTFTFTYDNGKSGNGCQDGRNFIAAWSCGSKDYEVTAVSVDGCDYTMEIESKYACGTAVSGSDSSSGDLSFGTILIIIVIGIVFLYCVIGYIICAKKNPDNGWGNVKANTPHLDFWCLVPKLAWAGCCVTKDFTVSKVNKIRGKDGDSSYDNVGDGDGE